MAEQTQQRCVTLFLNAIGSKVTQKNYLYELDRFLKWNKIKAGNYDDLLKADEKAIQRNLEDYLIFLKGRNLSPNTIPTTMAPIELFYLMNEININSKRLHKMFPTKVKKGGYGAYKREDIQIMLDSTNKKRTKSIILFLSSTGCRVGVLPDLQLKHITNIEDCKKVVCYSGSVEEYSTFMTPEASLAFDNYLEERQQNNERLTPESPAFRKDYVIGSSPSEPMQGGTIRNALYVTLKDVKRTRTGTRFNIPIVHGLRKYFNVTIKSNDSANISIAEKLMGHSVTVQLDNSYAPFSDEKLFAEYKKAIPELTISNDERQKILIEYKNKELTELERNNQELEEYKKSEDERQRQLEHSNARIKELELKYVDPEKERAELVLEITDKILKNLDNPDYKKSLKNFTELRKPLKEFDKKYDPKRIASSNYKKFLSKKK